MSYDHLKCVLSITIVWRWRSSNFFISFITWPTTLSLWHIMRNLKLIFVYAEIFAVVLFSRIDMGPRKITTCKNINFQCLTLHRY